MTQTRAAMAWALGWCGLGCMITGVVATAHAESAPVRGEILVRHVEQFEPTHGFAFRALRAVDKDKAQDVLTIALGDVATDVDSVRASLRDEGHWRGAPGQARLLIECTPAGKPTWMMIEHGLGYTEVDLDRVEIALTVTSDKVSGHIRNKHAEDFPAASHYRIDLKFELDWVDLR